MVMLRLALTAGLIYLATYGRQMWAMALLLALIALADEASAYAVRLINKKVKALEATKHG